MWNRKTIFFLYLVSILIVTCFQFKLSNQFCEKNNILTYEEKTLNTSQLGSNFSLSIYKPELFMIEGHLGINISSAISGTIHCALTERSGEDFFIKIN